MKLTFHILHTALASEFLSIFVICTYDSSFPKELDLIIFRGLYWATSHNAAEKIISLKKKGLMIWIKVYPGPWGDLFLISAY